MKECDILSLRKNIPKNYVVYRNSRKSYVAFCGKKQYVYSVNRYGEYLAEKLANMSKENNAKYLDYFENNEDGTTTFFINTKKYGIKEVVIDTKDASLFYDRKISISKDRYTYYAKTKDGPMHRIIMRPFSSKLFVDHINRNGLDNRRKNLRVVDISINNRNARIRKDNKTGYKGISEYDDKVVFTYYTIDGKIKTKASFSKNRYKNGEALRLAIELRDKIYKENGYIA